MTRTLFVIDGHSYIYQAFFGMPPLTDSSGTQVQATYAMTQLLLRIRNELRPDAWAVAMDSKTPTFRHEQYPEYKAHREGMPDELRQQIPWILEIFEGFGIPVLRCDGFEADDVVATLACRARDAGYDVRIISRDKDLEQLLGDAIRMWDPKDGSLYGPDELAEKRGLTPDRVVEYLALIGDKSDNVPGVAGVGPKTALKILEAVPDLDELFGDPPPEGVPPAALKKVLAHEGDLKLSRRLVELRRDVPLAPEVDELADAAPGPVDGDALRPLWEKLGFHKFLPALEEMGAPAAEAADDEEVRQTREVRHALVADGAALDELVARCAAAEAIGIHAVTDGDPIDGSLVGLAFSPAEGEGFYVPFRDPHGEPFATPEHIVERLRPILEVDAPGKIGEDLKRTSLALRLHGVRLAGVAGDTMIASYLINSTRRSYSLAALATELLHVNLTGENELLGPGGKNRLTFGELDPGQIVEYASERAEIALGIHRSLLTRIEEEGLGRVYRDLELPLIEVLTDMQRRGVTLDQIRLEELETEVTAAVRDLERKIHAEAGLEFNINSPKQLAEVLFERLGLDHGPKTKTGYSTSAKVLEDLAAAHPELELPRSILEYRSATKLLGTYIQALPRLVRKKTGRIHTDYSQVAAATGRLSSSDPNLQNIPVRNELGRRIRRAFVPNHPGWIFVSADYSQIELRVLAHICGDDDLQKTLRDGLDIHRTVAARIHGIALDEVTREQRSAAKAVNFGVIYGMGAYGLSQTLGIPHGEAKRFIEAFFSQFPKVREFIDTTIEEAREKKEVRTLFGRKRPMPDIEARLPSRRRQAEREAVNTVIQGTAADLIKKAMVDIHRALARREPGAEQPAMLLQIHDELLFEVARERLVEDTEKIRELMEQVLVLDVPLTVNCSSGDDWFDASK